MIDYDQQRAKRDRLARRIFFGGSLLIFGTYFLADAFGLLPDRYSFRYHTARVGRVSISDRYENFDPDLALGVAIGDTRYRFNYATHHAIVTRPLFGVENWVIPETVVYRDETYTVTAFDTFAFLNATTVTRVELPKTLVYLNDSAQFAGKRIKEVILHHADGTSKRFLPPFDTLHLPGDLEPSPETN